MEKPTPEEIKAELQCRHDLSVKISQDRLYLDALELIERLQAEVAKEAVNRAIEEIKKEEPKKEEPKGWERIVSNIRISTTWPESWHCGAWPIRISVLNIMEEGLGIDEYGLKSGVHPGEILKVKQARAIANALNEGCDIIEAAQKGGGK